MQRVVVGLLTCLLRGLTHTCTLPHRTSYDAFLLPEHVRKSSTTTSAWAVHQQPFSRSLSSSWSWTVPGEDPLQNSISVILRDCRRTRTIIVRFFLIKICNLQARLWSSAGLRKIPVIYHHHIRLRLHLRRPLRPRCVTLRAKCNDFGRSTFIVYT